MSRATSRDDQWCAEPADESGDLSGISVIIPTHDRDDLLHVAIRSALEQSLRPAEIIVVDDTGSTTCREGVESHSATTGVPISYVHRVGTPGAAASRQLGTEMATQGFVAYLDDDDAWLPWHLERCLAAIVVDDADLAVTTRLEFRDSDCKVLSLRLPSIPASRFEMFSIGPSCGSNIVVKRQLFDSLGWDADLHTHEDIDVVIQAILEGRKCVSLRSPTVCVRNHQRHRLREHPQGGFSTLVQKYADIAPRAALELDRGRHRFSRLRFLPLSLTLRWLLAFSAAFRDEATRPQDVLLVVLRVAARSMRGNLLPRDRSPLMRAVRVAAGCD